MPEQSKSGWRWLALPVVVLIATAGVLVLGAATYLAVFEWACPSSARLDSSCYSEGFLWVERGSFLLIASLAGLVAVLSGYWVAPRAQFMTAQWLVFVGFIGSTLALLALDWDMWPLYGMYLAGLLAALVLLWFRR